MMYWGNGMGGWAMAFMSVTSLLFWALVIISIVALVRHLDRRTPPQSATRSGPVDGGRTPQQTLAERFARGEIDEDEYRHRRQVLDGQPLAHPPGH